MVLTDSHGCPRAVLAAPANRAENQLLEPLLDRITTRLPGVVLADRAYDDDELRDRLEARGIRLISPHRRNRRRPPRHDGRQLRRYKRRYKVERTNSWLQSFRRIVIRYEFYPIHYYGFVLLACIALAARWL